MKTAFKKFDLKCECGGKMVLRESKLGKFYGCSKYPACKKVQGADQTTHAPLKRAYEVTCACGAPMVLRRSKWGLFYGCTKFPDCKLMHSAHQSDGAPMGRPGTAEERKARNRAHNAFDQLWQPNAFGSFKPMKRGQAYAWMRRVMGLGPDEAHIAMFNEEQCSKLIALVEAKLKEGSREEAREEGPEGEALRHQDGQRGGEASADLAGEMPSLR